MEGYKLATRYSIAYHKTGPKAGKTDIVVFLGENSSYTYSGLSPDSAHHLVDLLRNEKPIWINTQTGTFIVADEPVGSGEE
jgi:hypothetical protein